MLSDPSARADHLAILSRVAEGARVLDVGCGDGALLDLLKRQRGADARGLELSSAGVEACLKRGLSVIQGNADTDLEVFPDSGFDVAIASRSIQSLREPAAIFRELSRIAPEIIVSFRNYGQWRRRFGLLLTGRMPAPREGHWHDSEALHPSSVADMLDMAAGLNLNLIAMAPVSGGDVGSFRSKGTTWMNILAKDAILHFRRGD